MIFNLIKAGAVTLSLLVISSAAGAADFGRSGKRAGNSMADSSGSGFYVGINGGYGWGASDWASPAISNKPDGGMVGGAIGYNYQLGSIVLGLEGDIGWSGAKGSAACGAFTCETKNDWLGTVRGRVGYAVNRFLPFITGGGAYGNIKASSTNPAAAGASSTQFGWVAGGGIEYAMHDNWSVKLEYLHVDLGDFNCGAACSVGVPTNNVSFSENIFRAGVNYHFTSGPISSRY